MTIEELQTKRDEIINRAGLTGMAADGLSEQYGDTAKALALIDYEIARLQTAANTYRSRTTYASFRND